MIRFWKTSGFGEWGGEGWTYMYEGNSLVHRKKTETALPFWVWELKQTHRREYCSLLLVKWQAPINSLLVTICLQEKWGLTRQPNPVSRSYCFLGYFICAKQHKVVTDGWVTPVTFLLWWINFKSPTGSWKLMKMSDDDRKWMRITITLLMCTIWWLSSNNSEET